MKGHLIESWHRVLFWALLGIFTVVGIAAIQHPNFQYLLHRRSYLHQQREAMKTWYPQTKGKTHAAPSPSQP